LPERSGSKAVRAVVDRSGKTGWISNVQRHSTEDGPGIRTTVFLMGCPMQCSWCHNPEGRTCDPKLVWYAPRCVGLRHCLEACPVGALTLSARGMRIDRSRCDGCGLCQGACPAEALEMLGRSRAVEEVAEEALRDRVFYDRSAGGVTLSGGEPSVQREFAAELMRRLRAEGVHVALDTCGGTAWGRLAPLVELADLVLYDLKLMDAASHRDHTGIPLEMVLENARSVAGTGKPMWVRTPVIPGITDGEENLRSVARFILSELPNVERYDLLAFNNTCVAKYRRLDWDFALEGRDLLYEATMERLAECVREEGAAFVRWSGMTKRATSP
jgi:pyruvate formate lyase activating enzyme